MKVLSDTSLLNQNIRKLRKRKRKKLTGQQIAIKLRIPYNRYRVIEYANAAVTVDEFLTICEHYKIGTIDQMKKMITELV